MHFWKKTSLKCPLVLDKNKTQPPNSSYLKRQLAKNTLMLVPNDTSPHRKD